LVLAALKPLLHPLDGFLDARLFLVPLSGRADDVVALLEPPAVFLVLVLEDLEFQRVAVSCVRNERRDQGQRQEDDQRAETDDATRHGCASEQKNLVPVTESFGTRVGRILSAYRKRRDALRDQVSAQARGNCRDIAAGRDRIERGLLRSLLVL